MRRFALTLAVAASLTATAQASPPGTSVVIDQPDGFTDPFTGAGNTSNVHGSESVSADGRYVVFTSDADGMAPGDDDRVSNVYRKDRLTGAIEVVSVGIGGAAATGGDSSHARISDDGTRVAFGSDATNLVPDATDGKSYVYLRDLVAGTTVLMSREEGPSGIPIEASDSSISGDGGAVAFVTSAPLHLNDKNKVADVYLRRLSNESNVWVSRASGANGGPGAEQSLEPSVDRTGSAVAFSTASAFDAVKDGNSSVDVYRRILGGPAIDPVTQLMSGRESDGKTQPGTSGEPSITADGESVAFQSSATGLDLQTADTSADLDVYVRHAGGVTLASAGIHGAGEGPSSNPDIAGGPGSLRVAFHTRVTEGGTSRTQVGVRTLGNGGYEVMSARAGVLGESDSYAASLSRDADVVVFGTLADDLVSGAGGDYADVVAREVGAPAVELVSAPASGPLAKDLRALETDTVGAITPDGRYAVFGASHDGLATGLTHVYRRDLRTGRTLLVDRKADGAPSSEAWDAVMSQDGNRVVFVSDDRLLPADTNDYDDIYVRDLATGATVLVSKAPDGTAADDGSEGPALDADGDHVVFTSDANNMTTVADPVGTQDVFVADLSAGTVEQLSRVGNASPNGDSVGPVISADGTRVAFHSSASDLLAADTDKSADIYVAGGGSLQLASVRTDGTKYAKDSRAPVMSADGNRVAFPSDAPLDPVDTDALGDVYVRDLASSTTTLVSRATGAGGAKGDLSSYNPTISPDGDAVAFGSVATNLGGPPRGMFVRRLSAGTTTHVGAGSATGLTEGGACLMFETEQHPAVRSSADHRRAVLQALTDACTVTTTGPVGGGGGGGNGGGGGDGPGAQDKAPVLTRLSVRGKRVRFRLDRSARVTLRVKRRGAVRLAGVTGRNRMRMPERWTRKPGRYRIVARARDGRLVSAPRRARFRVR